MINSIKKEFTLLYNCEPDYIFKSPARVNLIGEHIDYNGGMVLPAAISLFTFVAISKRKDNKVLLSSKSFNNKIIEKNLLNIEFDNDNDWVNYPMGIFDTIIKMGFNINCGLNLYFDTNIPLASGLSSSASILVLTCFALNSIFDLNLTSKQLAEISTKSEREFNGLKCGIMDEASIALGKKNSCLYLNTSNFTYEYHQLNLEDYELAILKTNKPRKLTESKYNERVAECNEAINYIKSIRKISNLCELTSNDLTLLDDLNPKIRNRVLHVILENERVRKFIFALKSNDLVKCGELLNESHYSLRDLYEVTGEHLDTITELARTVPGVLGARMTGAGFGGCAIALVHMSSKTEFIQTIHKGYKEKFDIDPEIIFCEIVDGPSEIK